MTLTGLLKRLRVMFNKGGALSEEHEERNGSIRIPAWLMPVIVGALIAFTGFLGKKVWDMSDQILRDTMRNDAQEADIMALKDDRVAIINMGADLRIIKDKVEQLTQATQSSRR